MTATAVENPTTNNSTRKSRSSKTKTRTMSDEHKEALAQGRKEGKIVNDYLDGLDTNKPQRGRPITVDSIKESLAKVNAEIVQTTGTNRLKLIQRRMDLEDRLRRLEDTAEIEKLQKDFIGVAKSYAERSGMTYAAFREYGVPAAVLKEAGISR